MSHRSVVRSVAVRSISTAIPRAATDATVLDPSPNLPDGSGVDGFTIACEACEHGASGSGIFDSSGALLGVLTAASRDSSGRVRAIEAVAIAPHLTDLEQR